MLLLYDSELGGGFWGRERVTQLPVLDPCSVAEPFWEMSDRTQPTLARVTELIHILKHSWVNPLSGMAGFRDL